jgi:hypothetical protein
LGSAAAQPTAAPEGPAPPAHLGLEQAVERHGKGAVAAAADRRLDPGGWARPTGQALGGADRPVRRTAITVVGEPAAPNRTAVVPRRRQRVEHKAGVSRAADPLPAMRRAKAAIPQATCANPCPVATCVTPESPSAFGRGARYYRFTRSSGQGLAFIVVLVFLPRTIPRRPMSRLSAPSEGIRVKARFRIAGSFPAPWAREADGDGDGWSGVGLVGALACPPRPRHRRCSDGAAQARDAAASGAEELVHLPIAELPAFLDHSGNIAPGKVGKLENLAGWLDAHGASPVGERRCRSRQRGFRPGCKQLQR